LTPGSQALAFPVGVVQRDRQETGETMDLDGRLHDLVIMTNTVEDLWKKMADMISDMDMARDGY